MSTCFYVTNQDKGLFVRQGLHHKNKMMFLEKQSIDPSGFNVYVRKEKNGILVNFTSMIKTGAVNLPSEGQWTCTTLYAKRLCMCFMSIFSEEGWCTFIKSRISKKVKNHCSSSPNTYVLKPYCLQPLLDR